MLTEFLDILRAEFAEALTTKTSFGRNEMKLMFEQSISAATLKYMDAVQKKTEEVDANARNDH